MNNQPVKRLYRSKSNRIIGGVCGGLAEYLNIDANALRVITALLTFVMGMSLWVYLLAWLIIPEER
ncbi:MAG: PspC domain-containing protein [Alistipes sp.]|nr:PspC domain-containing protein [Alistipes sp.]